MQSTDHLPVVLAGQGCKHPGGNEYQQDQPRQTYRAGERRVVAYDSSRQSQCTEQDKLQTHPYEYYTAEIGPFQPQCITVLYHQGGWPVTPWYRLEKISRRANPYCPIELPGVMRASTFQEIGNDPPPGGRRRHSSSHCSRPMNNPKRRKARSELNISCR